MTPDEEATLEKARRYSAIPSLVASAAVLLIIARVPSVRTFASALVACLAAADVLRDVACLLGGTSDGWLCTTSAVVSQFADLSTLAWSVAISCVMRRAVLRSTDSQQHLVKIALACTLGPGVLTALPATTHSYGHAGHGWCWISGSGAVGTAWRFLTYYVWVWLAIGYCAVSAVQVRRALQRMVDAAALAHVDAPTATTGPNSRLLLYPLVMIGCYTFPTLNRLQNALAPRPSYYLYMLHAVSQNMFGLGCFVVFVSTPLVRRGIGEVLADRRSFWLRFADGTPGGLLAGPAPDDDAAPDGDDRPPTPPPPPILPPAASPVRREGMARSPSTPSLVHNGFTF